MPTSPPIRFTIALTVLFTVCVASAETYVEPRVFDQSLDFSPLQLSEAIAAGLPTFELNEHVTEIPTSSCMAEQTVPLLTASLPPLRMSSETYLQQSILPGRSSTSPGGKSLITRDFDLSGFSME